MKKMSFLACLASVFLLGAVGALEKPVSPSIKVLIANSKPGLLLEVRGKYKIYDPHTMEHLSTRFVGKRKYLQALSNGIKWGEEFPGIYQLLIVPDDPRTITLIEGVPYEGSLYIYDVAGQISVVNDVDIEKYVDSILTAQNQEVVSPESLGALAIANRTQAYYYANHPKTQFWAVEAGKAGYQGYMGRNSSVEKALQTTKYLVLTEGDQPFNARWEEAKIAAGDTSKLASQGENAVEILKKAFPRASLKLMQSDPK